MPELTPNEAEVIYRGFYTFVLVHYADGAKREMLVTTDSVAALVYLTDTREVIVIRQHRLSRQIGYDANGNIGLIRPDGSIVELVAGRDDKNLSPTQTLIEELQEEIGAQVDASQIEWMNQNHPMTLSAGALTERCHLAFVAIESSALQTDREVFGNAHEHEVIERLQMPAENFLQMRCNDLRVWAMQQWLRNYYSREAQQ